MGERALALLAAVAELGCDRAPDSSLKDASHVSICSTVDTRTPARSLYLSEPSRQHASTNPGVQAHIAANARGRSALGVTEMTIGGGHLIGFCICTFLGERGPPQLYGTFF